MIRMRTEVVTATTESPIEVGVRLGVSFDHSRITQHDLKLLNIVADETGVGADEREATADCYPRYTMPVLSPVTTATP